MDLLESFGPNLFFDAKRGREVEVAMLLSI